ncbi:MAG: hypothetical protein EXR77_14065 [Myxococcales bacterium]|nr:hypothetical protein [Myxococcales bacterium]
MSEARPITNVTDFVCGACWTSFSKSDPGVDHGDQVLCPHCGHAMPVEVSVVDAVNAATIRHTTPTKVSDGFDTEGGMTLLGATMPTKDFLKDSDIRAAYAWLPPDMIGRSSEPAGFVVGEADEVDDFGFNDATLRPDESRQGLLDAVRDMAEPNDPTPVDFAFDDPTLREPPAYAGTLVGKEQVPPATEAILAGDASADADDPAQEPETALNGLDAEAAFIGGDWKLRAMGLTYNFHGLEALIGRASSKAGQAMQVSVDGTDWKDFDQFFLLYKSGSPASEALAQAGEPGSAAPIPQGPPMMATAASPVSRNRATMPRLTPPELSSGPKSDEKAKAAVKDKGHGAMSAAKPSNPNIAASKGATGAAAAGSRRQPVVAAESSGGSGLAIAIGGAVVAVLTVAILWWQDVISIAGF